MDEDKTVRKPVIVLVALVLVIWVMACSPAPKPQEFKSEAGRFSVMAPVALEEETQTYEIPEGKVVSHMFAGDLGGIGYVVVYADNPEEAVRKMDPEKFLDRARDGAVNKVNGKLVTETKITLEGNPGREFVVEASEAGGEEWTIKVRLFLVKNRLYVIDAAFKKGKVELSEVDRFLQSFKLIGK